jgi:hypothetical protein
MRGLWRRCLTLLALYAVTLHVILLGFFPIVPGEFAPVDPFSIICHTTGPAAKPGEPPPGTLHFVPGRAIDQCNLCTAAAPPPAPDIAVKIDFKSARILHVLRPHSVSARSGLTSNPNLIRGPPLASS